MIILPPIMIVYLKKKLNICRNISKIIWRTFRILRNRFHQIGKEELIKGSRLTRARWVKMEELQATEQESNLKVCSMRSRIVYEARWRHFYLKMAMMSQVSLVIRHPEEQVKRDSRTREKKTALTSSSRTLLAIQSEKDFVWVYIDKLKEANLARKRW